MKPRSLEALVIEGKMLAQNWGANFTVSDNST